LFYHSGEYRERVMDEVAARIAKAPPLKQGKPKRAAGVRPVSKTSKRIRQPNYDPRDYRPASCR
jgi:hypothetical protein